jgi:hypothetical protein
MSELWSVPLPDTVRPPFEVYVNGLLQVPGEDFDVAGRTLLFSRPLAREGKLGTMRWLSIFLGIAGTYRKNDSVDVVYQFDGRRTVAAGLPIIPPSRETPG